MYQAKLIKVDSHVEEEVSLEVNGLRLVGFASICPYQLTPNNIYPVNISLTILDGYELKEIDKPIYSLERINDTFRYIIQGKICGDSIDLGNGVKIQDEIFEENSYLDEHFIQIIVDRLSIEFI